MPGAFGARPLRKPVAMHLAKLWPDQIDGDETEEGLEKGMELITGVQILSYRALQGPCSKIKYFHLVLLKRQGFAC